MTTTENQPTSLVVDGVLMPNDMLNASPTDQTAYAAKVKTSNRSFIAAYFALEDRAAELGVELPS